MNKTLIKVLVTFMTRHPTKIMRLRGFNAGFGIPTLGPYSQPVIFFIIYEWAQLVRAVALL
jgi:hypothetical protein